MVNYSKHFRHFSSNSCRASVDDSLVKESFSSALLSNWGYSNYSQVEVACRNSPPMQPWYEDMEA